MPERQYRTLTKRIVDRLTVNGKDAVFWDSDLPGFGIRVYPTGRKVYVVQTRTNGKSKRVTVGRHGDISPDEARKNATKFIARMKAGQSPVEAALEAEPTVADLAERYEREYVAMHCKPNTIKHYGLMLKKHIVPLNINDSWNRVRRHAGLDGVRLHDLRHSFASRALALGEGLPMIGELLGHQQVNTTARYAHLARESVRTSTAKVAESIGADILTE